MKKIEKKYAIGFSVLVVIMFIAMFGFMANIQGSNSSDSSNFSIDIEGLTAAKESEIVTLNNGDVYEITAKPVKEMINGQEVRMLSYNGTIPGPTIVVNEGDEIKLQIKNELDVATTIHPHGINGDNKNDGVPEISQEPIEIGESYTQTIKFPEAGLFWYHPHIREDYTQASGMYANFIVKSKDNSWPKADKEQVLQLSDIALTEEGIQEFSKDEVTHTLMGRFGNTQLVNGKTDYVLGATSGEVQRLYLTNTSSVRSFRFEIPGVDLKLIGGDNGLFENDSFVSNVTIAPSERVIVDVLFPSAGAYEVRNNNPESNEKIATIDVSESTDKSLAAQSFEVLDARDDVTKEIEQLTSDAEKSNIKKRLATRVNMNPMFMQGMMREMMRAQEEGEDHEGIEWEDTMPEANSRSNKDNTSWSLVDLDNPNTDSFDWEFNQGNVVTISVENSIRAMHPMQHPIHLHGQKFIVTKIDGKPTNNRVFKDVVQIPVGSTYELVVRMDNKGTWLLHCHIPEHMESGMVGKVTVN